MAMLRFSPRGICSSLTVFRSVATSACGASALSISDPRRGASRRSILGEQSRTEHDSDQVRKALRRVAICPPRRPVESSSTRELSSSEAVLEPGACDLRSPVCARIHSGGDRRRRISARSGPLGELVHNVGSRSDSWGGGRTLAREVESTLAKRGGNRSLLGLEAPLVEQVSVAIRPVSVLAVAPDAHIGEPVSFVHHRVEPPVPHVDPSVVRSEQGRGPFRQGFAKIYLHVEKARVVD